MDRNDRSTEGMQGDGVRDAGTPSADNTRGSAGSGRAGSGSAANIREHMKVVGSDGQHVGTVDRVVSDREIKLTRRDSPDDEHHFIPTDWVQDVGDTVRLDRTADDARREWRHENAQ